MKPYKPKLQEYIELLARLSEGQECYCPDGSSALTESGVGVCLNVKECVLARVDRLLVDDYHTAIPIE